MKGLSKDLKTIGLTAFVLVLLVAGCKTRKGAFDLREALIGEWTNASMVVEMHSHLNSDSNKTIQVKDNEWKEKTGFAPIKTNLKKDGSFFSEYRTVTDSLFYLAEGTWEVKQDSLIMQFKPKMNYAKYKVEIHGNSGSFTGLLDWDQDGKQDDFYKGIQRKTD